MTAHVQKEHEHKSACADSFHIIGNVWQSMSSYQQNIHIVKKKNSSIFVAKAHKRVHDFVNEDASINTPTRGRSASRLCMLMHRYITNAFHSVSVSLTKQRKKLQRT